MSEINKKLLHEFSEQEILNLLQNEQLLEKESESNPAAIVQGLEETFHSDVVSFAAYYNISPGNSKVKVSALYVFYRAWSKSPVSKTIFSVIINRMYERHGDHLLLNTDVFKISEHLFKILQKKKKKRRNLVIRNKHIGRFINKFQLRKDDTHFVHLNILYFLYDKWCYKNKVKNQLAYDTFKNYMAIFFTPKSNGKFWYFGVGKEVFNLFTEEQLMRLQKNDGFQFKQIKKKNITKKQS